MLNKSNSGEPNMPITTALVPANRVVQLYRRMQAAIADCYAVEQVHGIADQANAIAAYYKQIKDDESVKKFLIVKLRAWRRIGEILCKIDRSDCETMAAYERKIKAAFPNDQGVQKLKSHEVSRAVKIGEVPAEFFEEQIHYAHNTEIIVAAYEEYTREKWKTTPEGKAAYERLAQELEKAKAEREAREKKTLAELQRLAAEEVEEKKSFEALKEARAEAFGEVGITLARRDRENVKEVVLILREPIHALLRQAAFDHHLTMQAVLRNGLVMWLFAHGYKIPAELHSEPSRPSAPRGPGRPPKSH